jgi:hypothetical protein
MHEIGTIVSGSLTEGLTMRLATGRALEEVKAGKFISVKGEQYTFFSLITDIQLLATHPDILLFPPTSEDILFARTLKTKDVYVHVKLRPMIMLNNQQQRLPVKTIPAHFSPVYESNAAEINSIFGSENINNSFFSIGTPLDMETPVCINLDALTERSNGIFGKTGTGKTFITRLLLAGLIHKKKAVNLIFDMHSEYGLQARQEGNDKSFVKGLKTLFPQSVAIFSLDPVSTRRRGCTPDVDVFLTYEEIRVEDIIPLADELNLNPTAIEAAYLIASKYQKRWLSVLLSEGHNIKEFSENIGAHPESIGALYRKLKRLERFSFLKNDHGQTHVVDRLLEYLDRSMHVILEFGNHTSMLAYLLISGIITRRIHEKYVEKTEKFLASQKKEDEPQKLLITIEEAHKFLNPQAAKQTIFGVIAREMRKYYVSLLVVDQRPSGIDPEIISQIGTKFIALLNDEKDIAAVLTGVSNGSGLKSILSTLDTKKQILALGHALPMPVVLKTRNYDETFYQALGNTSEQKDIKKMIDELF